MEYDVDQLTEAFEYLDDLRESGATNMFGAPAYVTRDLAFSKRDAMELTSLWMKTFDGETSVDDRVNSLIAQCV